MVQLPLKAITRLQKQCQKSQIKQQPFETRSSKEAKWLITPSFVCFLTCLPTQPYAQPSPLSPSLPTHSSHTPLGSQVSHSSFSPLSLFASLSPLSLPTQHSPPTLPSHFSSKPFLSLSSSAPHLPLTSLPLSSTPSSPTRLPLRSGLFP